MRNCEGCRWAEIDPYECFMCDGINTKKKDGGKMINYVYTQAAAIIRTKANNESLKDIALKDRIRCTNCSHKFVCTYKSALMALQNEIETVFDNTDKPFYICLGCEFYKREELR